MSRESATRTLTHYISALWVQAGRGWDADHAAEIESIIESVADAAVAEANAHADQLVLSLADACARLAEESAKRDEVADGVDEDRQSARGPHRRVGTSDVMDSVRRLVAERVATEEASMRLLAVCGADRVDGAMVEVGRREHLFAEAQRTGPVSMPVSPKRAALDSVCQDVMRGYWVPPRTP